MCLEFRLYLRICVTGPKTGSEMHVRGWLRVDAIALNTRIRSADRRVFSFSSHTSYN